MAWLHDQKEDIADKPNLEYFVVALQFDGLWFLDCHKYWACDCDFQIRMCTSRWLIRPFVGWHNGEVITLSTRDHPVMYVPVRDW